MNTPSKIWEFIDGFGGSIMLEKLDQHSSLALPYIIAKKHWANRTQGSQLIRGDVRRTNVLHGRKQCSDLDYTCWS